MRTDNGLEYVNDKFNDLCREWGIARHKTAPSNPQQNGVAERMNRTLMDKVRCLLINAKLPGKFWAEAVMTACYLVNRSPSTAISLKTPEEMWSGRCADYNNLRVFGCPAYVHIKQGKLEPRAMKGVFLGYPEGVKGYKIWCQNGNSSKSVISRDVTFNELEMLKSEVAESSSNANNQQTIDIDPFFKL
ncbi:hypothetical protein LWI29_019151 [Acer saccharum]|uniref:Integrase catalytic domain-containing protein n=1 Tax=Acer saccharum TaxID=4024 RepID=A0AA39VMT7_ACESA|nr:hypothetical protein LWI29_019151 [Acer saccharum]